MAHLVLLGRRKYVYNLYFPFPAAQPNRLTILLREEVLSSGFPFDWSGYLCVGPLPPRSCSNSQYSTQTDYSNLSGTFLSRLLIIIKILYREQPDPHVYISPPPFLNSFKGCPNSTSNLVCAGICYIPTFMLVHTLSGFCPDLINSDARYFGARH